ncbi:hypothetical protein, partial [Mesorhizobium sp. M1C.F.Ca.ET.195.01.1.1]|uniref:hypothetical protein n=1 Tax=Mesorhizobium sp. M1C.F.Ca.ET.195.01.1.1 TaxID=2563927 RepID=UPI001AEE5BE7
PEMAATETLDCAAADPNETASIVPARNKLLSALVMSFPFSFFQLLKPRLDPPLNIAGTLARSLMVI